MTRQVVLGVDVGTSDTKVLATTPEGIEISSSSATTHWTVGARGHTDADAARLLATVISLLDEAVAATREVLDADVEVTGIAVTGMAEAGVLLDPHGRPAHPVIAWYDPRGAEQLAGFPADMLADFPGRTGLPVTPLATVAKLAWMRDQGTDLAGHCWLNVPEYVANGLTGVRAAETSLVARTGLYDQDTSDLWAEMLDVLGASTALVPDRRTAGTPWGRVGGHAPASVRGAVVTVAGHDHPVAALGCGVIDTDALFDDLGTAEAFVRSTETLLDHQTRDRLARSGFNVVSHVLAGRRLLVVGTRGGLVLRRTLALLGVRTAQQRDALDAEARALSAAGRAEGVVTVSGAANDDGVLSITSAADASPAELWLAALDHTVAEAARLLDVMTIEVGPATSSVVAGGWTRMASVRDAKTASLPAIRFSDRRQAGAFGAAAFAACTATGADGGPTTRFLSDFTSTPVTPTVSEHHHPRPHQEALA